MEPIKINLKNKIGGFANINVKSMTEYNNELVIELTNSDVYFIKPGMKLYFLRDIYVNGSSFYTINETVDVLYVDDDNKIHTTVIPPHKIPLHSGGDFVRRESWVCKGESGEDIECALYYLTTKEPHNIFPQDLNLGEPEVIIKDNHGEILGVYSKEYLSISDEYYLNTVTSADCITYIGKDETCGKRHKTLKTYRYDFLPKRISRNGLVISGLSEYIIHEMSYMETSQNPFYYYYIERNDDGTPKELDYYGNPVKHCHLYTDLWWKMYDVKTSLKDGSVYVNSGNSNSLLFYDNQYWTTNVCLSSSINESLLGSSDNFNTNFVEELEQSLIPAHIDMEKTKYVPMVFDEEKSKNVYHKLLSVNDPNYPVIYTKKWVNVNNMEDGEKIDVYVIDKDKFKLVERDFYFDAYSIYGGNLYREEFDEFDTSYIHVYTYEPCHEIISSAFTMATSITFNLHFRKRNEVKRDNDKGQENNNFRQSNGNESIGPNTPLTSGNVYTDGWFINEDDDLITWWNGFDYSGETFDNKKFEKFYEESGTTSDLIGYLNFTDNDIYYRKKKVSQSFLRFSFYSSNDPINQKLLHYSTSFLDSTTLYGKYLKQMMFMQENDLFNTKKYKNINLNAAVVFCSADTVSSRVDTKTVLTNEYDRTKSSEGFNLYFFSDDKNLNLENAEKTIYMKIEFNHAGNGKTIPLIMWPKDENGNFIPLTMDNFIENLYIPVKLTYIDGKYSYYIPNAINNEDGNIELVLFEPKLEFDDYIPEQ